MSLIKSILKDYKSNFITDTDLAFFVPGPSDRRYGQVKRAIQRGDLIHIRRGLFCLSELYRKKDIHTFELAQRLYGLSYISFESALSYHGWIPEAVYTTTSASAKRAADFKTPLGHFSYVKMPEKNLFVSVSRIETETHSVFFIASPWKAFLDYCYVSKTKLSLGAYFETLRIEKEDVVTPSLRELQKLEDYYRHSRLIKIISEIKAEFAL